MYLKKDDEEKLNSEKFPKEEVVFTVLVSICPVSEFI